MAIEVGFTRLKFPPDISAIGLPQPDGTTYQVRPGEDGIVDVPDAIAAELTLNHGFEARAVPQLSDDELSDLRARRDALKARLDDLEAEEAAVSGDGVAAGARLDQVKRSLAIGDGSLAETRKAERAVEETRSRTVLIAEAVAVVLAELSTVARRVAGEESIRETIRQTALSEPLLTAAAENVEAFATGIGLARDALRERAEILARLAQESPRVNRPTLTVAELGTALQAVLADSEVERQPAFLESFTRLAALVLVGPVFKLESSPEARARLATLKVSR